MSEQAVQQRGTAHLTRFRWIAIAEGISYVVLLFIAMPLKYGFDMPLAVKYVGWAHGVLFMAYVAAEALAAWEQRWTMVFAAAAFLASLIPFGTFVLDWHLRKEQTT